MKNEMWTTKTFLTKTKRGNILKIVREHYLRDDLLCGSAACKVCPQKESELVLDEVPKSICALFDYSHYVVVDTNVILHQIDVLEEDALTNVIILQTVLEEVKHQNSAIFQRLLEIMGNKKRKFYSFVNEHHKDTYVERRPRESVNDRNDRAIRAAAAWYSSHLSAGVGGCFPRVVLMTDDEGNRTVAQQEGIVCCSARDYVENTAAFPGLADKLSRNPPPEVGVRGALFPAHLTPAQLQAGVRAGALHHGTYRASRDNYLEGSVTVAAFDKPVLLQGLANINRSVDGDVVAVEILPREEWRRPSDLVLEDTRDPAADPDDPADPEVTTPPAPQDPEAEPTGRVVGIVRRKWRQYCGVLQLSKLPGATRHLFVPAERRAPRVRVETRQGAALAARRVLVALDSWPRHSRYPLGHFVRDLGPIGDKAAENEVLLLEHDVPHARFSEAVLACLPPPGWTISDEEVRKRRDLRALCVCSVDPPGCTDIDDALHARPLPETTDDGLKVFEVGVHIADVTHFVRPGTPLDNEAASRATTVYLVDKRIDMVPDLLSSNLCSLRGGEERLAFSCVWRMDENANVLDTTFHKSVIKSRAAMTYAQAQLAIDDATRGDEVATSLRTLNALAKRMKQRRLDNGALLLASPEIRFQVDSETHEPLEVQAKQQLDTNSLVEEFMLLANVSVAARLAQDYPRCALLRRHPPPPPANFTAFLKAASQQGIELDVSTNKSFSSSLDRAVLPGRPYFNTLLRILATRCMMQAVYFCSGARAQEEYYHYGLACPIYTHFTSPIRRYADVIVHRLLAASIGADTTHAALLDTKLAEAVCDNLNYRHRQAQLAGRASVALNTHILFASRVETQAAVVLAVKRNALHVLVPTYGLEGPLYLPADRFLYNDEEHYQVCGDVTLKTFDEVTVRLSLDSSNVQHRKLVFQLVEPKVPGFSYDPDGVLTPGDAATMDVDAGVVKDKRRKDTATAAGKKRKKRN